MNYKQALKLRATYIPAQEKGDYKVERVTVPKGTRLALHEWERFPNPLPRARKSTRLVHGINSWSWRETMMSDTAMELRTSWQGVRHCHGHVLVGGLGLGLCLKMLDKTQQVKSITCVERSQEVCNMVAPHLGLKKLRAILTFDFFDFLKGTTLKFDTAYADLSYDYNSDHYADYVWRLQQAYRGVVKNPRVNARYWIEEYLKWAARKDHGSLRGAINSHLKECAT